MKKELFFSFLIVLVLASCVDNKISIDILLENNSNRISPIDVQLSLNDSCYYRGNINKIDVYPSSNFKRINIPKGEYSVTVVSKNQKLKRDTVLNLTEDGIIAIHFNYFVRSEQSIAKKRLYGVNVDSIRTPKSFSIGYFKE